MMGKHTKRQLDAAVDELKRDGYSVLIIMMDKKKEESEAMGSAVEVLCSETNDPKLLAAMLKTTVEQLSGPVEADRRIN